MTRRAILTYTIAMVVVISSGIELSARLLRLAPPLPTQYMHYVADSVLPHKPAPGSHITGRSETNEFDVDLRHNSLGFRDDEPILPKPSGSFRILGLGDGFTYGIGSPIDSTYLSILETLLNQRAGGHPVVDVVNMGVPRFYTETERLVLETYGQTLQPDLVIVGFLPNDVADTRAGLHATSVSEDGWLISSPAAAAITRYGPIPMMLYRRSHAARVLMQRFITRSRSARTAARDWASIFRPNGSMESSWLELEDQLRTVTKITEDLDAEVVVLHIPQKPPWSEAALYPPARLARVASLVGFHFVDAMPAMASHDDPQALYWPRDGHCTPEGYALIGRALYDYLTDRGLVP